MADDNELLFQMKMQDQMSGVLQGIEGSFKDVASVVQQQMAAMKQLTAALQAQAGTAKNAGSAAQAHAAGLKAVGEAANAASAGMRAHESATKASASAHGEHAKAVKETGEAAREAAEQSKTLAGRLGEVTSTAKEAVEAMIGLYASNEMAKAAIEASEELEHTIRDIGAAAGVTRDQVTEMLEALNKKAGSGFAFAGQLEGLAKIGSTMSASTEQMEEFAVALGKISNGSNFQQIGNSVAQLLAQTNEGPEKVGALADALGKLGLQTRGGVEGLASITNQIARFTGGMDVSSTKIVGYAATFAKLFGPEMARHGAMEFGSMLQNIAKEAREGGDGLQDLAARLGTTYEEMRKLGAAHPDEVFQKILQVTNAIKSSGGDPAMFLKQFGLGDGRSLQQIETLAEHFRDLQKGIDQAQNAAGGADAFNAEKLTPYDVAVRQLSNAWKELKEEFGKSFTPTAIEAFQALAATVKEVTSVFHDLPEGVRTGIAVFAIIVPALGGVALGVGALVRAFRELKDGLISAGIAFAEVGGRIGAVGTAAQQAALKMESAATGAVAAHERVALAAKETEAAVRFSWGNMALAAGTYAVAVDAAIQLGKGIAGLIQQQQEFGKQGISWRDEALGLGAMLPSFMGGDGYKSALKGSIQREQIETKRGAAGEHGSGGHEEKHGKHKEGEKAQTPNPTTPQEQLDRFSASTALGQWNTGIKAVKEYETSLRSLNDTMDKMSEATKAALATEIQGARQAMELRKAELDPLNKMTDAWRQSVMSARAYTAAQKEAAAIEKQVFDARKQAYKDGGGDAEANRAESQVRQQQPQVNRATSDTAYAKEAESMYRALAASSALTTSEKDRLAVLQQIAKWQQDTSYTQGQITQLTKILELTKQWERELSQMSTLNPQLSAIQKYNDELAVLNKRLADGKVSREEFAREKTSLDQSTLAARNPIGKISQDQGDELAQLQVVGKYREADLKTLQQITELKRAGAIADDASGRAIAGQIGANNRMLQDVKDTQQQLNELSSAFGSSLQQAVQGALNGNRGALREALASLGGKLFSMGTDQLFKQMTPSIASMFPGMVQKAQGGIGALGKLGEKQMDHTIASASQEIAQAQINIANATMAAGLTNQGAANAGAPGALPGPAGTNLPGSTGAAGATPNLPGAPGSLAQVIAPGTAAAAAGAQTVMTGAAGAAGIAGAGAGATVPVITSTGIANVPAAAAGAASSGASAFSGAAGSFGTSLAPTLPGNGVGSIKTADWTSFASGGAGKGPLPASYDEQLKTFGGTPTPGDWRTDFGHTGFQIQNAGMGQNKYLVAGLTALGKGGGAGGSNPYGTLDPNAMKTNLFGQSGGAQGMPFPQQRGGAWGNMPAPQQASAPSIGSGGDFYHAVMAHESGGRNILNGGNPNGAAGYYQIMPQTWKGLRDQHPELGLPPKAMDASFQQQTAAYQQFTKSNVQALQNNGLPVTDKNAFMESWFGPTKGPAFLKQMQQNPNQSAASLLPKEAAANTHDFYDKQGNAISARQFYENQTKSFGSGNTTGFGPKTPQNSFKLEQTSSLDSAAKQAQEASQSQMQQAMQAAKQTQEQMTSTLKTSSSAFGQNFNALSSGIKETGSTALGAVPDMGSFSNSISQMVSKLSQSGGGGGGGGGFGGLFGGGGGGGGFMDFGGGDFAAFHSGGVVGSAAGDYLHRKVSSSVFIGAQRFHDGLNSDEFPAILQRGERVLTNAQEQKTTSMVDRLADAVASKGGPGVQRPTPASQRTAGSRVNMVVNVKDANSFRMSQPQIMAQAHASMMRSAAKHN